MENSIDTVIGINVTVKGNLYNKGSIQVNGNVEGEVKSDENIMIGETAKIKGPVIASKVEVSGEVRGLVEAKEKLEINPTGKIFGDINAHSLLIKEGALFIGKSVMPSKEEAGSVVKTETEPVIKEDKKDESKDEKTIDKLGFFSKK